MRIYTIKWTEPKRLLIRFERISAHHYGMKYIVSERKGFNHIH
jgi:hypothetical protein